VQNRKEHPSWSILQCWEDSAKKLEHFWMWRLKSPISDFLIDWYDSSFWAWDFFHATTKAAKEVWNNILDRTEESIPNIWKDSNPLVKEWFDFLRFTAEAWDLPASTEAARRYYSTKTFGSPNVAAAIPRYDLKFWDYPYGFRFRGEQQRVPFYWGYPNYSLRESCRELVRDPIKTDPEKEPRLLFVTVDVQSGDTVSFDSYPKPDDGSTRTRYNEYDENAEEDQDELRDTEYDHLITYPEGIKWEHLSTTFSLPDLYRYASLKDESSLALKKGGSKRTYWDGGLSSNTPLRELISKHKEYWKTKLNKKKNEEGREEPVEIKTMIPPLNVYIADVWPAKITDYPVPSDNDFVIARRTNLLLMDKTEYEESVTKMITDYRDLVGKILENIKDQGTKDKIKEILDKGLTKSTIHAKNKKTYQQLLLDNTFDIDRVMRIERKDDTYAVGLALADFSGRTIRQLLVFGRFDALDKLIDTLSFTLQHLEDDELKEVPREIKARLRDHLCKAREVLDALGNKANYYSYDSVMKYLHNFVDEVNMMETKYAKDSKEKEVIDLLRP
jgi:NTE family protein